MNIYAYKFREKGKKDYVSVLLAADTAVQANHKFESEVMTDLGYDIDRRTISWAGSTVPFMSGNRPEFVYANLDDIN